MTSDGKSEAQVRKTIQVGVNVWRMVEGVMADRKISRMLKRKVVVTWEMLTYLYGVEMLALTEKQQVAGL